MLSRKLIAFLLVGALALTPLLAACDGAARIDIDVDPDTGQGTIDIIGGGNQGGGGQQDDSSSSNGIGVDNAIVIAAVALLLGVIAIVISLNNRPR